MLKMAILGVGTIAKKMADTIHGLEVVEAYAVASREFKRADDFAKQYGFTKAYGSYQEMLQDEAIELVYVATPHSHHYKHVKMCLEHNKHVLCEKAFTVDAKQAIELFEIAETKKLLLTEAIWTRYMPSVKMITDILSSGVIGEVTSLTANLGYTLAHIPRLVEPELAGGALLDLGVYLVHFARMIFGTEVERVESTSIMLDSGVDAADNITIVFKGGKMAVMHCNMRAILNRCGSIYGTEGYIEVQNFSNPKMITIYNKSYELVKEYGVPEQITGYEYEVLSCKKAIEEGRTECPEIPHAETVEVMKILDDLRASCGYEIPIML